MKYNDYEKLLSIPRLERYLTACNGNRKKTLSLYKTNIRISTRMFSILSLFEVILRNKIDTHYKTYFFEKTGSHEWLLHQSTNGGYLTSENCQRSLLSVKSSIQNLGKNYSHDKLVAELTFGFWRFQFASKEFMNAGSSLHKIFINRPSGVNHTYIFKKLSDINKLRNRIAHHEPICFGIGNKVNSSYIINRYSDIAELIEWMGLSPEKVFRGLGTLKDEINLLN